MPEPLERPKLPPNDPYSEDAEDRRAQRDLDRAKAGQRSAIAEAIAKAN